MPLTPAERAELDRMRAAKAAKAPSGGLTEAQKGELRSMRAMKAAQERLAIANQGPVEMEIYKHPRVGPMLRPKNSGMTFLEGVGQSMTRGVKGAGNLLGMVDDETLREQDRLDAPLKATGEGQLGGITGEMALSAPLAAIPGGSVAGKLLPNLARAAGEGAIQGAIQADPDEQGMAALVNAGIGAGMTGAFRSAARGTTGVGADNFASRRVQEAAANQGRDVFVPANLALARGPHDDPGDIFQRGLSWLYRKPLSASSITGSMLQDQSKDLGEDFSKMLVKSADRKNILSELDLADPRKAAEALEIQARKDTRDAVGRVRFGVSDAALEADVRAAVRARVPNINDATMDLILARIKKSFAEHGEKGAIRGGRLDDVMDDIRKGIDRKSLSATQREGLDASLDAVAKVLDKPITPKRNLPKVQEALEEAAAARESEVAARVLKKAAGGEGEVLNPARVSRLASEHNADELGFLAGQGRDLLENATTRPRKMSWGTVARALPGLGIRGVPSGGVIPATEALLGTKPVQNALLGRYGIQQSIANALRNNSANLDDIGTLLRSGTISNLNQPEEEY